MIRTREQYLQSLKALRPNIYKFGELIEDVTTHPATKRMVESHCRGFDAANTPEEKHIFVHKSSLTGKEVMRNTTLLTSVEELMANAALKRAMYRKTGTCAGAWCVGWNSASVLWAITHEIDKEFGTDYQKRLEAWILHAQEKGLMVAGALTDAKGDRSKKVSEQDDLDTNLRIVEYCDNGDIVISGCKAMICGVAASEEIFLLPGGAYKENEKDWALACVVPRDIEGLTLIEARHPSDIRDLEEGFDAPATGDSQSWLIFDKCRVPKDRVFMAGEYAWAGKVILYFTANYRACIGACVAGQGDVMIGASVLMARANGLSIKPFQDKMVSMSVNNETTYAVGVGAMACGKPHPSGIWLSDSKLAHTNKVHVATLPYETKRLCQEIGGGIVETGCFPSYKDFTHPTLGPIVQRYMKAGAPSAEARARAARLSEWLTVGGGIPGCMHGGGSPDGAKMVVHANTPYEEFADYARKVAGITEEIKEAPKQK